MVAATAEAVRTAKTIALHQWRARAAERWIAPPPDLSGACKFCSWFAAGVFGGQVEGHYYHQWCRLPDGTIIDLAEDAADVRAMLRGDLPDYAMGPASAPPLPQPLYTHDARFMRSRAARDSNASVQPRVTLWVRLFSAAWPVPGAGTAAVDTDPDRPGPR